MTVLTTVLEFSYLLKFSTEPLSCKGTSLFSESLTSFSPQLSQDFKVSNGGPINKTTPAKINRCLFKIRT